MSYLALVGIVKMYSKSYHLNWNIDLNVTAACVSCVLTTLTDWNPWNPFREWAVLTRQNLKMGHRPNMVRRTADAYMSLAFAACFFSSNVSGSYEEKHTLHLCLSLHTILCSILFLFIVIFSSFLVDYWFF